jgi:hypothetical protein
MALASLALTPAAVAAPSTWTIFSSPSAGINSTLTGVTCPSATTCVAVGASADQTIVESWNGSTW